MKGSIHLLAGAATGFAVAHVTDADPTMTLTFVTIGGITALFPDMDINGKLSNKITFSYKALRTFVQTLGFILIVFSFIEFHDYRMWLGILFGVGIVAITHFISRRFMLTLTGLFVLCAGIYLTETWIILLGVYIIIASFVSHRTYTHSLVGLLFFMWIAYEFDRYISIDGVFLTCILGYSSHLLLDMKWIPFNKRGVKLLLPFSKKEL